MSDSGYKVSVVVLTYNPIKSKLFNTIKSIIVQKGIQFQIVISDDASEINFFEEIKELFEQYNFIDYKLRSSNANLGTVENMFRAVSICEGEYIKAISPGDFLISDIILVKWIFNTEATGYEWSFGDAVYYMTDMSGEIVPVRQEAHPHCIDVYRKKNDEKCRWNYIVLDDICMGAATVCKREIMLQYLDSIMGKVIYAEDNIYRIMMFDGVLGGYYENNVMLYEYGEGISTSKNNKWNELLREDWDATTEIISKRMNFSDEFGKKISKALRINNNKNKCLRLVGKLFQSGRIQMLLYQRFRKRMTSD